MGGIKGEAEKTFKNRYRLASTGVKSDICETPFGTSEHRPSIPEFPGHFHLIPHSDLAVFPFRTSYLDSGYPMGKMTLTV